MRTLKLGRKWRDKDGVMQEDLRDPDDLWDSFLSIIVDLYILGGLKVHGVVTDSWDGCLILLLDGEREVAVPYTSIAMIEKLAEER